MTPKEDSNLLREYLVRMALEARGKRTMIHVECPDIIKTPLFGPATEDEEIGTNQSHGRGVTTAGPGTIDHDAGPLSQY